MTQLDAGTGLLTTSARKFHWINDDILHQIFATLEIVEKEQGKKLGDPADPFLVSVRSGSRASMPGMMDTILNLGLNDQSVQGLAKLTDNPRFAYDCYRRFIQMYSDVVTGLGKSFFETIIDEVRKRRASIDTELTADDLKIMDRFGAYYKKKWARIFPRIPKYS